MVKIEIMVLACIFLVNVFLLLKMIIVHLKNMTLKHVGASIQGSHGHASQTLGNTLEFDNYPQGPENTWKYP